VIKERADANGVVRKKLFPLRNDPVRINFEPLQDLVGIFNRWVSDGEEIRILLNVIGYRPTVESHFAMIEKVV